MCVETKLVSKVAVLVLMASIMYSGRIIGWLMTEGNSENFLQLVEKNGYTGEEHTAVTEDGYILTVFRINRGKKCHGVVRTPPVLLMHGLLQSSDSWLDAGPDAALVYLLSDACYDTWVGNARGNYYSRKHKRLNPDVDTRFWEFSTDEVGFYDVPATIDYILNKTDVEKLNYIGFSQGADSALIMISEKPDYSKKVGVLMILAAPTRLKHMTSAFKFMLETSAKLEYVFYTFGVHECLSNRSVIQKIGEYFCRYTLLRDTLCQTFFKSHDTHHPGSIKADTFEIIYKHFPAGTSIRTMARYGQVRKAKKFQKYDFGKEENLKRYGNVLPPEYDLGSVSVPSVIIHGAGDTYVNVQDVEWLARSLPNLRELYIVDKPLWNHFDMTYSRYNNESLFPKISSFLLQYSFA